MPLSIDFETRSAADIRAGAWHYASDATTEVLCLALLERGHTPRIWIPFHILAAVTRGFTHARISHATRNRWQEFMVQHVVDKEEAERMIREADKITAFNAGFETAVWENPLRLEHNFIDLPTDKLSCTAARAAVLGLPRSLEKVAQALALTKQKDKAGAQLIQKLCKPRTPTAAEIQATLRKGGHMLSFGHIVEEATGFQVPFWNEPVDNPEDYFSLFEYCIRDVEVESDLDLRLPDLIPSEQKTWQLDQIINKRGVKVDSKLVNAALDYIEHTEDRYSSKIEVLTDGAVKSVTQRAKLNEWLIEQDFHMEDLRKNTVADKIADPETPPLIREVLELRAALSQSSTAKYKKLLAYMGNDGRIRDLYRYHGAGTGRWAGKGIQVHNLPRGVFTDYDNAIRCLKDGDYKLLEWFFDVPALTIASTLLRPCLIAEQGYELICSDYSSIEGRVLAWLSGEEEVLDHYRAGRDMYLVAADTIYGGGYDALYAEYLAGDKSKRTIGKPTELGLGFGGGIGAFSSLADVYRVDCERLPEVVFPYATMSELRKAKRTAEAYVSSQLKYLQIKKQTTAVNVMSVEAATACDIIKRKWRDKRKATVKHWHDLEKAAILAVQNQGIKVRVGRSYFLSDGKVLRFRLPSGRSLFYVKPQIKTEMMGRKARSVLYVMTTTQTGAWVSAKTYGGKLAENETQAVARDLLRYAMHLLEEAGYPIVLHVHDEICCEVPVGSGNITDFEGIMSTLPPWADGLPLAASGGWRGHHYRKE